MPEPFVHLDVHSGYTLGAGASRLEEIAARAAAQGHAAVALTDTDAVYGSVAFQAVCDAVGVRPVVGVELTDDAVPDPAEGGRRRAVLLVRDAAGWRSLSRPPRPGHPPHAALHGPRRVERPRERADDDPAPAAPDDLPVAGRRTRP